MGCGKRLLGALLIIFNILVFALGLVLLGVGVWSVMDKLYVSRVVGDDLFSAASYLLMVGAMLLLGLAVLGFCAVRKEQRALLLGYFITLLAVSLILLIAAILAVSFKAELEGEMTDAMRSTLLADYGDDPGVTQAWDQLQRDLKCCGVRESTGAWSDGSEDKEMTRRDSWLLFQQTPWYREARLRKEVPIQLVPRSCCVYDDMIRDLRDVTKCQTWQLGPPGNLRFSILNNALHYDGCYEKAYEFIADQANIILACAFAFSFTLVAGLVLTFLLYRSLGEQTRILKR